MFIPDKAASRSEWPQSGDSLLLPFVSIGNVGQLSIDLILNTLLIDSAQEGTSSGLPQSGLRASRVGLLKSRNVLPAVGVDPLDVDAGCERLCTSLEVFRIACVNLTVVQIRSPVEEGCMETFVREIFDWVKQVGFDQVVAIGGADGAVLVRGDEELLNHKFRFIATPGVVKENLVCHGVRELPVEKNSLGLPYTPISKAGLLNILYRIAEEEAVLFFGLIYFTKEGFNVPEAHLMATLVNSLLGISECSSQQVWKPPASWSLAESIMPDQSLF